MQKRWKVRPEGATWGDFGEDDELGRLNLLTPERVLAGAREVSVGKSFCLSLPLDLPGGTGLSATRKGPSLRPVMRADGNPNMNFPLRCDDPEATDIISDDQVTLDLQFSTQWDSLAHVGQMFDVDGNGETSDVYYNGFRAGRDIVGPLHYCKGGAVPCRDPGGARKLGVENMAVAGVQGRGVMIDLFSAFGYSGKVVGYEDLMAVMEEADVRVEEGDLVCLRTGLSQLILDAGSGFDKEDLGRASTLDGSDRRLQQWITETGLVALIADNYAVETLPARSAAGPKLPLHAHCLFRLGVYLGELWYLTELADWLKDQRRTRFLLTAPPLRLPGAVGSPTTPVATV